MGIFRRKKMADQLPTYELAIPEIKHEHTWKDMPWYMEEEYSGTQNTAEYKIIEPYICITCGERKNVVLEKCAWQHITPKDRDEEYLKVKRRYKEYLKPRAVVEDMINNILLVKDPSYLQMVEKMRGIPHSGCGTSSTMPKSDFKVELKKDGKKDDDLKLEL